jgi:hypothetical protein
MTEIRTFSSAPTASLDLGLSAQQCFDQATTLANMARLFPDKAETFLSGERRWRRWAREARGAEPGEAETSA